MLIIYSRCLININSAVLLCILVLCLLPVKNVFSNSFEFDVPRAFFTSKLIKGEPVNEVLILENDIKNLYFFSEVKNLQGKVVFHRWEYRGKKVFEKKFKILTESEYLISRHKLDPTKTGEWMVVMTDDRGWPIKAAMFKYVKKGSFAGKGILPIKH